MTGTEPRDWEPAAQTGPAYRDRWGLVGEGRQMSRPALVAAVIAVCGTGLVAGLGLFGGSAPQPRPAAPAAAVVRNVGPLVSGSGSPTHERPLHRRHMAHHQGAHAVHVPQARRNPVPHLSHDTTHHPHMGSTGAGVSHRPGRHRFRPKPAEETADRPPAADRRP